jgi:hypothetical protein
MGFTYASRAYADDDVLVDNFAANLIVGFCLLRPDFTSLAERLRIKSLRITDLSRMVLTFPGVICSLLTAELLGRKLGHFIARFTQVREAQHLLSRGNGI